MTPLYDGPLEVHYGYFYVVPRDTLVDDLLAARAGQSNGLLGAREPHRLAGITGLHTGAVSIRVEWTPDEPPVEAGWEDVVEASVDLTDGEHTLVAFDDEIPFAVPHTGWHRARYSATAMDAGHALDTALDEPAPDSYLLQLWPAPEAPDVVVRQHSQQAGYWHDVARSGR